MSVKGAIHSIETFSPVDEPGVRFVIFLKDCAIRCQYYHNPDTWRYGEPGTGNEALLKRAMRYRSYWNKSSGITVNGGEPLLRTGFPLDLFQKAKKESIHTVLDTVGNPFIGEGDFFDKFQELMNVTDLILLDLRVYDEEEHRALAGKSNRDILDLVEYLPNIGKPVWIRHVLVPGTNDSDEDLQKLGIFLQTLHSATRVEILPYHILGAYKQEELGYTYALKDALPPDKALVEHANGPLHTAQHSS